MIVSLNIRDVALIEAVDIEFGEGLNIISGETGAGKSMVIDSLNFILGQRPPKDFIRAGAQTAQVECVLEVSEENKSEIAELGIGIEEDNLIIIERRLMNTGKTSFKMNGKTVTVGMVKEVSSLLFDLHGQHEHQSLLKASKHIQLLDRFCGEEIIKLQNNLSALIKEYKSIISSIREIETEGSDRESRLELYRFQINEIDGAALKPREEEELNSQKKVLENTEEIMEKSASAINYLSDGAEGTAVELLSMGKDMLEQLSALDPECESLWEAAETVFIQLDDMIRDLKRYAENLEHDPQSLAEVENRLDVIYRQKLKYGKTVEDILEYGEKVKTKYEILLNSGERLDSLKKDKKACEQKIVKICGKISELRKKESEAVARSIEKNLRDLGMKDARFEISIERKQEFSSDGFDKVEFLISPNIGEEVKPLAKIASGGEISRVMLALKNVLADVDTIETFVFDEIDTGVSGRTAQMVAEKMSLLAKKHQILCITHLPQIAAMADIHLKVEKKSGSGKTVTQVYALDEEKSVNELARLIGGAKITDATLAAAAEMRKLAK